MPRNSAQNAISRQWEILRQLPVRGAGASTQEICQRLQQAGYLAGERTIQRDLRQLQEHFSITCEEGRPARWSWAGSSQLAVAGLPIADAVVLKLLERFIKPLLPEALTGKLQPVFDAAGARLDSEKRHNELAGWADLVEVTSTTLTFVPPAVDPRVLSEVQAALVASEFVEIDYSTSDGKRKPNWTVAPLGLVQAGSITYLVCRGASRLSDGERDYRLPLHRVHGAGRTYVRFARPKSFRLSEFVRAGGMEFGEGRLIRLKLKVAPSLAQHLEAARLADNQRISKHKNGEWADVVASVRDTWRLEWWLLSKTGQLIIQEPCRLRARIGELLAGGSAAYEQSGVDWKHDKKAK